MNDSRLTVIQIQLEALDELYKVYQEEFKQVGNQLRDLFLDIKPQTISPQRLGETHLFQQPQNTNTTNMKIGKQKFSKKTKSKSKEKNKNHKSNHSKDKQSKKYKHKKQLSSTSSSQSSSSLQSLSSSTFSSISSSESVKKYKKRIKPVQKLKLILPKISEYEIDAKPMNNNQVSSIVEYNLNGHRRLSCNKNLLERVDRIMNNDEQNKQKDDSQLEDLRCELKNHLEIGNNIRYYQMNPFEQCYRCKSSGHHEKQCILPIAQLCNYCLGDHTGDKCINFCCFKCNQIGHRKQDCKFKQLLPYCIYCSRTTHLSEKCQVIRSTLTQYDTICLNCRQLGHINCNNTTANY